MSGELELKQILELVSDFKTLLTWKDEEELDKWIKRAENIQISELDRFLKLIYLDKEAIKNTIRYEYSN